jgi:polar amino acid transport system substrate-binding protein
MKIKNVVATLALGAAVTISSTAAVAADKVRIAIEGAYAPFNMVDANGELQGFDVDIAKALCAEMNADCTLVQQDWDGMIPGLVGRKYDAIVASMSITEERLKVVDFSERYYSNVLAFIAPKGTEMGTDKSSLKGMTIGAQRSTIAGQYLEDNYSDVATIKLYDTQDNAYLDLAAGRLDAMFSDKFPAYDWIRTEEGKGFEFKGADVDIDDKIAIATRKGDGLKGKFSNAIKAIRGNGKYAEINAKYFPFDIY